MYEERIYCSKVNFEGNGIIKFIIWNIVNKYKSFYG